CKINVLGNGIYVLQAWIDAHLAFISQARRLPDDIIHSIFVACLPYTRNPVITPHEAPLLLCQVCSAWRTLALSTPLIWAAVHIVVPAQPKVQVLANTLTMWLGRSGACPLSISV
ncbi:hypothetical protein C8R43DRAFT_864563, partial [Mycena crocata]